jgi:hypothetical protein
MAEIFDNNLSPQQIGEIAARLIESAGGFPDFAYIATRADRGWCAGEIARAYVRSRYPVGDITRRRLLTALTKLGAPAGRV